MPVVASVQAMASYEDQVIATFSEVAGRELEPGMSVVVFDDRESDAPVAYLLPAHALIACSPAAAGRVAPLDGRAGASREAVDAAMAGLGASPVAGGVNYVLPDDAVVDATVPDGYTVRWLDPSDADDKAFLDQFIDESDPDDIDEVEIERDAPDPAICVLVDTDGKVAAYASGRPFWAAVEADDVGVLVAPAHRRRGLGAAVVAAFVERRRHVLPQLYRHNWDNEGSEGVARSVGYAESHQLVAYSFGD